MVTISRRSVLTGVGAAALLTAAPTPSARADGPNDQAAVMANLVDMFAGTAASNGLPEVAAKVASIDKAAHARLDAMDAAGDGELFAGLPLGTSDANLNTSYSHLYDIALATRTPHPGGSSDLEDNATVQQRVIDKLVWLYERYFGDQATGYYGNWWNWEIGIPRSVGRTLVLLGARIRAQQPDLLGPYVAAMDAYLRNGKNGDVDLDSRFHTGANLADITTNRILQGAVAGDDARITKAVSDQQTVFTTVDPYHLQHGVTDGYYADGSFIQHASVAYTGSYGRVLLSRVTQTIKLLDGTGYAPSGDLPGTVVSWVRDGFAPLIFEGWMMEIVKGRQVSSRTTGYADVRNVIESVVDLSAYASASDAAALRSYVKYLATAAQASADAFESPVSVQRYDVIMGDQTVVGKDLNPAERSVAFNAMDRTVHRRPGYAFALARSSSRISKYEYMSGQNLMPWFQGDGSHYLYLSGQDQTEAFGVDYFVDVSPYRLSGTTVPVEERKTVPQLYGRDWYENPDSPLGFTSSSESQNTYVYFPCGTNRFSGGATLGAYGVAGMIKSDSVAYRDKQAGILPDDFVVYPNAASTTSWIMLDDEVVVLTAGVRDAADRDVVTTMDSRIAAIDDQLEIVGELRGGRDWHDSNRSVDLSWLRYRNVGQDTAVGYVLLAPAQVQVDRREVSNSLRIVRESNPDTMITKDVFTLSVTHPADDRRPGAVAYALVPNATVDQLRDYSHRGPITVLSNTSSLQAVHHRRLGLTALNAFTQRQHRVGMTSVDGAASVLIKDTGRRVDIAVSDPTFERGTVTIEIADPRLRPRHADDGVQVSHVRGRTRIQVTTHQAYGRSFTATLTR